MLLNKIALSSFAFKSANALLFFQCALCMLLVLLCKAAKLVKVCRCMRGGKSVGLRAMLVCKGPQQGSDACMRVPASSMPGPAWLASLGVNCWPRCLQLLHPWPALPAYHCIASYGLQVEPFSWGVVRVWLPVNVIFVGMIGTSFWALRSLNVGMVTGEAACRWNEKIFTCEFAHLRNLVPSLLALSGAAWQPTAMNAHVLHTPNICKHSLLLCSVCAVLKNLTNLFTLCGDYLLYGRTYRLNVWGCVALMMMSALCGAITDLSFSAAGYFWQVCSGEGTG